MFKTSPKQMRKFRECDLRQFAYLLLFLTVFGLLIVNPVHELAGHALFSKLFGCRITEIRLMSLRPIVRHDWCPALWQDVVIAYASLPAMVVAVALLYYADSKFGLIRRFLIEKVWRGFFWIALAWAIFLSFGIDFEKIVHVTWGIPTTKDVYGITVSIIFLSVAIFYLRNELKAGLKVLSKACTERRPSRLPA